MGDQAEAIVRVLLPAMAAQWRVGAEYGVDVGAKAAFQHAYNYVCEFGPSGSLVNLMLIEREIVDKALRKLPNAEDVTCTVSMGIPEVEQ